MPAFGVGVCGVEGAGLTCVVWGLVGASVVVVIGQSNEVIGGKVVQSHARSVLVWMAYDAGESPHMHHPGPLAMAVQVFWGSAA